MKNPIIILAAAAMLTACAESLDSLSTRVYELAKVQFTAMDARLSDGQTPRSYDEAADTVINANIRWWCSGYFPGSLWYVYEATGDEAIKTLAEKNTLKLSDICSLNTDHDIGFQVNCSYGNAFRVTSDSTYLPVMEAAAAKLAARMNPTVGCIKSWNSRQGCRYPVIIDNMMNLELLMVAANLFDCDSLRQVAYTHANTTMANHFRPDYSCYHLVDYVPETGEVDHKQTVQGYAHESSWARGQSWALYGYTMMYAFSQKEEYLAQAENVARYILPELPSDGIPYWDFNAPGTPHEIAADAPGCPDNYEWKEGEAVKRDASAGAVMASAFAQLSRLTPDKALAKQCHDMALTQVRTLASEEYLAEPGTNGDFLLKHSVGNLHKNHEVDVPLTYADYYFLEALHVLRK